MVRELTREEAAKVTSRADLLEIFSTSFAATASRNLDASLDGHELHFQCVERKYVASDHVRCDYRFVAPLALKPGQEHKLKFHECNYVTDDFSRLHLYLGADDSIRVVSSRSPDAEMMKPTLTDQRKPGDSDKPGGHYAGRVAYCWRTGRRGRLYKPAFPPADGFAIQGRTGERCFIGQSQADRKRVAVVKSPPPSPPSESAAAFLNQRLLRPLLCGNVFTTPTLYCICCSIQGRPG